MNRRSLAQELAKRTGVKYTLATEVITSVFDILRESLENEEKTIIHNFGTFRVRSFSERKGINPNTLKDMQIKASKRVKFTASKTIKIK